MGPLRTRDAKGRQGPHPHTHFLGQSPPPREYDIISINQFTLLRNHSLNLATICKASDPLLSCHFMSMFAIKLVKYLLKETTVQML